MADNQDIKKKVEESGNGDIREEMYSLFRDTVKHQLSAITLVLSIAGIGVTIVVAIIGLLSYNYFKELTSQAQSLYGKLNETNNSVSQRTDKINEELYTKLNEMNQYLVSASNNNSAKVNDAVKTMSDNFDKLSGRANLKPNLKLLLNSKDLNSQNVNWDIEREESNFIVKNSPKILLLNSGGKEASDPNIYFYLSDSIDAEIFRAYNGFPRGQWEKIDPTDEEYYSKFHLILPIGSKISTDKWIIELPGLFFKHELPLNMRARLEIVYGGEFSLISNFFIKPMIIK